jgi:hypothetical protein
VRLQKLFNEPDILISFSGQNPDGVLHRINEATRI